MKVTRKTLLIVTAVLGGFLIVYSAFRMITKIGLPEKYEKWLVDGIIFGALAIFMYNRKLARDEKRAREDAERAALEPEPVESGDDDRPHWERKTSAEAETGEDESAEDEAEPEEKPDARR
jgi:hypothetical protein